MSDLGMASIQDILREFEDRGESILIMRFLKDVDGRVHTEHSVTKDLLPESQMKMVAKILLLTARHINFSIRPKVVSTES